MDMQYEYVNAMSNLKCILEPFFLEKSTGCFTFDSNLIMETL